MKTESFVGGVIARIEQADCASCGHCEDVCAFSAIRIDEEDHFVVDPVRCEGCGVCHAFCPTGAARLDPRVSGDWFVSKTDQGPMVHARLGIAEENSGKLVTLLRKTARKMAEEQEIPLILVDGPPGIGCPVIASLTSSDAVLIITEPTLSGEHDMLRARALCKRMGIPSALCINKYDLNMELTGKMIAEAQKENIPVLGKIPFDPDVTRAMVAETCLVDASSGPAAQAVHALWDAISDWKPERTPSSGIIGAIA